MTGLYAFWKACGEEAHEEGYIDYAWVQRRLYDREHPVYGPPLPMSMRPPFDRILHEVYGPALREQINNSRSIFWVGAESTPIKAEWFEPPV